MSENKALKLIVFSDVHYGPKELGYGYYEDKRKLTEYALPLTHQLIQIVNEMKPDMVAYLGDFIQETGSLDADKLNFKKIWNEFSKIFCSVLCRAGQSRLNYFICSGYKRDNGIRIMSHKRILIVIKMEHLKINR